MYSKFWVAAGLLHSLFERFCGRFLKFADLQIVYASHSLADPFLCNSLQ
jgi:hypothetical protein